MIFSPSYKKYLLPISAFRKYDTYYRDLKEKIPEDWDMLKYMFRAYINVAFSLWFTKENKCKIISSGAMFSNILSSQETSLSPIAFWGVGFLRREEWFRRHINRSSFFSEERFQFYLRDYGYFFYITDYYILLLSIVSYNLTYRYTEKALFYKGRNSLDKTIDILIELSEDNPMIKAHWKLLYNTMVFPEDVFSSKSLDIFQMKWKIIDEKEKMLSSLLFSIMKDIKEFFLRYNIDV